MNIKYEEKCDTYYSNINGFWSPIDSDVAKDEIKKHSMIAQSSSDGMVVIYSAMPTPPLARDNFDEEFDSMFSQNAKCMEETDPNGISQHEAGAKLDNGKPMAGRLLAMFGNALYAVSEVGTFGANKYTEGGWQHVQDGFKRYDDAGMRHFLKRGMGEEVDPDSNLPHLAHEAWNALAKLELYLRDKAK